jgi:hypothetical protein
MLPRRRRARAESMSQTIARAVLVRMKVPRLKVGRPKAEGSDEAVKAEGPKTQNRELKLRTWNSKPPPLRPSLADGMSVGVVRFRLGVPVRRFLAGCRQCDGRHQTQGS